MGNQIKGIEIKGIDYEVSDRGVAFVAPLFMDNQEIGTIENKGNGGLTTFCVSNEEAYAELIKRIDQYFIEIGEEIPVAIRKDRFAESIIDMFEFGKILTDEESVKFINS